MEQFGNIIQIVAAFVSTVLLPLILLRSTKKKAEEDAEALELKNNNTSAQAWKELYEKKEVKVAALDVKIDTLYADITKLREDNIALERENAELKIKNGALEFRKCNKHGCPDRMPPSDF